MGHAFASHQSLGRLADESVYQADFAARLRRDGFEVHREVPLTAAFETFTKTYSLDLVVTNCGVYEIKAVARLSSEHEAQLRNYLLLLNLTRGKLVNFRPKSVESRFVNAPATLNRRRSFDVDKSQYLGEADFLERVVGLLRDWGAGLELPLYQQAITELLASQDGSAHRGPADIVGCSLSGICPR